jgi:predicted metal-dependent enzyme (double-stranded beta helix superfamily)
MGTGLDRFIAEVDSVVCRTDDEYELTAAVAELMSQLLAGDYRLPREVARPSEERHLTYPLYIDPGDRWSLASVVWSPGQQTPVHSHETWGVVGIYAGTEREQRYLKPTAEAPQEPLAALGVQDWRRGQVTICCTTDDDVHAVTAVGDGPTIGIHVYGGNIGTIKRRSYDPATGAAEWFVSGWDTPEPA